VIMGSECGCLPVPEERIIKKWRLQPGKMFLVDLERGRIVDDKELKDTLASGRPYAEWIERIRVKLDDVESDGQQPARSGVSLLDRQQAFGYTQEDIKFVMTPMAVNGGRRPARWATTPRWRCCRTRTRRSTIISSSFSRR
jgi:glutamate synthase (NADPH/NADH) large chain/glutamate synthase (ferredoxin)